MRAAEQNIVRRCIFQTEAFAEEFHGEIDRQSTGLVQHLGRPFVWVACERDAFMLEDGMPIGSFETTSPIPAGMLLRPTTVVLTITPLSKRRRATSDFRMRSLRQ